VGASVTAFLNTFAVHCSPFTGVEASGEWFLSRRDSTIVARHEVPGMQRGPVPEGRSKSLPVPQDIAAALCVCRK